MDEKFKTFLNDNLSYAKIEEFIKASKFNKKLLKDMKKMITESNKVNNKSYDLKLDIVDFEVYFHKSLPLMFSVFTTSENKVCIYDNIVGNFYLYS